MTAVGVGTAPPPWSTPVRSGQPSADRLGVSLPIAVPAPVAADTRHISVALGRRRLWERRYRRRLIATDSAIIVSVTASASLLQVSMNFADAIGGDLSTLSMVTLATAAVWLIMLWALQTRATQVTCAGSSEYARVAHATGLAFGMLAIGFILFHGQGLQAQLVVALPIGVLALLIGRRSWRRWLIAQRLTGTYVARTIVVGRRADVEHVISTLQRNRHFGYQVVGAVLADASADSTLTVEAVEYPVVGTPQEVAEVAKQIGADTIIISSQMGDAAYTKRLSWQLEGTAADLVLSSRLTDVAGPRISLRQVDGLPLVQVRIPTFDGAQHVYKRALDIAVSFLALLPIVLMTPLVALMVNIDSPGPVLFRQRRVGLNGREFDIVKFRTMRCSAEDELPALLDRNEGAGPMFKIHDDPRITRVGALLRRASLDELPQFWNVLRGDMSVVGPRPPLPSEVGEYDDDVRRRLYIKPGITGLWQVSGRSDLSWEQSVRLDLHYVENWSVLTDLMIMWRTAQVMVRPKGAY
jgi:exopolysaccharide biosynthesis polyprenyl glycosylphosphotransferase